MKRIILTGLFLLTSTISVFAANTETLARFYTGYGYFGPALGVGVEARIGDNWFAAPLAMIKYYPSINDFSDINQGILLDVNLYVGYSIKHPNTRGWNFAPAIGLWVTPSLGVTTVIIGAGESIAFDTTYLSKKDRKTYARIGWKLDNLEMSQSFDSEFFLSLGIEF